MFQHIHNLRFIDVFAGWPGHSADGSVLKHSPLSQTLPQLMDNNSQCRIQDFPEEGVPTPWGGANIQFCQIFPKTA